MFKNCRGGKKEDKLVLRLAFGKRQKEDAFNLDEIVENGFLYLEQ